MPLADDGKNHLGLESSPYLLQHAKNPVAWFPWGEKGLQLAIDLNRPILLSIGYSACHWCHVMAHESFEDPETASLMNELFVNIKVDREERPDLDKIYQSSHQLLTQRSGGWPLTVFITPKDHIPFFTGTYFPPVARHGLPSFRSVLKEIADFYRSKQQGIESHKSEFQRALASLDCIKSEYGNVILNAVPLDLARNLLEENYDSLNGGFGAAPKFPHIPHILRLLRHWQATRKTQKDERALTMSVNSLCKMANGGLNDHIGGGFYRYSVDAEWQIPHFEKMLYDNGLMLYAYTEAWKISNDPLFKKTAITIADWVIREMQSPDGGYYSSIDADSDGGEGNYYLWQPQQLKEIMDDTQYPIFECHFGLNLEPNFKAKSRTGWHLTIKKDISETASLLGLPSRQVEETLLDCIQLAFNERCRRTPPAIDHKILTAWNALMIKGMAVAGRVFARQEYMDSAKRALGFVSRSLLSTGQLYAVHDGERGYRMAFLDDYAYLLDAALETLQTEWSDDTIELAVLLADNLINRYEDKKYGGFYFTSDQDSALFHRPKPLADDALPSGNGVAAYSLLRLGYLLGNNSYIDHAEKVLHAAWGNLSRAPHAHNTLLSALEEYLSPPRVILLTGPDKESRHWKRHVDQTYLPRTLCFIIPVNSTTRFGIKTDNFVTRAYICQNHTCSEPVTDLEEFVALLNED